MMARVTDLGGPDLTARLHIASENGDAVLANNGRVNAETRPRVAVKYRVRVGDEVFDAGRFQ